MFRNILHLKRIFLSLVFIFTITSIHLLHVTLFRPCMFDGVELSQLYESYNSDIYDSKSHSSVQNDRNFTIEDIYISVKTTRKYHSTRVKSIVDTWFQLASDNTWFFTDYEDELYQNLSNNHMVQTNCPKGHARRGLCCKMNKEYDYFMATSKKYWCHFDDDQYVNIPKLVQVLSNYPSSRDWYLGKTSTILRVWTNSAVACLENKHHKKTRQEGERLEFWFGTGGAGICISRALANKMKPLMTDGRFSTIASKIDEPDDATLGFVVVHLLKVPLTILDSFHSHYELMSLFTPKNFRSQVSFGQIYDKNGHWNVVKVDGFSLIEDPFRFYSLHCFLFPKFDICRKIITSTPIDRDKIQTT